MTLGSVLLFSRQELEILLEGLEAIEKNQNSGQIMASLMSGLLVGKSGRAEVDYRNAEEEAKKEHLEARRALQRRTLPLRAKLLDLIEATPR